MTRVADISDVTGCMSARDAGLDVARAEMRDAVAGSSTARETIVSDTQMTAAASTIVNHAIARIRRNIEFELLDGERLAVAVCGHLFLAADPETPART